MKMHILKKIGAAVLTAVFLSACSQVSGINEERGIASGMGRVYVSLGGAEKSRTVTASVATDFTDIKLSGKPVTETSYRELGKWGTTADLQLSEKVIELKAVGWNFVLEAKRNGVQFRQFMNKTILAGTATHLDFSDLRVETASSVQTGAVSVKLKLPDDIALEEERTTAKLDTDSKEKELKLELDFSNGYGLGESYWWTEYKNDSVPKGNRILVFTPYDNDNTAIFTYPVTVVVETGYTSSAEIDARTGKEAELKKPVTVTYVKDAADYAAEKNVSTNVKEQAYDVEVSKIISVSQAAFAVTGKRFLAWNTKADGSGTTYIAGDKPALTANLTLYAQWGNEGRLVTYRSNYNDPDTPDKTVIQSYKLSGLEGSATIGFSLSGKKFMGWDTKKDGTGKRYGEWDTIAGAEDITVYAQWCTYDALTYKLSSASDWNAFFNRKSLVESVELASDFTAPNLDFTTEKTFSGTFNGNGKKISGITKRLFASIGAAGSIQKLTVHASSMDGVASNGIIASKNEGAISECTVEGSVKTEEENAGGIVGENSGTISKCVSHAVFHLAKSTNVGSIAGLNAGASAKIEECEYKTAVNPSKAENVGGYVGKNGAGGTITKCVATEAVTGEKNVGGIAGYNGGVISYCNSSAAIDGIGTESNIGGIAGFNNHGSNSETGSVTRCHAWGTAQASRSVDNTCVGGIIGRSTCASARTVNVEVCAAAGTLIGGKYQGGLIGYNDGSRASYCYAALEAVKYYKSIGTAAKTGGLYGLEVGDDSRTGWVHSYTSSENGVDLHCTGDGRDGSFFKYNVLSIASKLSKINEGSATWTSNTGAHGVSASLPYEVLWN